MLYHLVCLGDPSVLVQRHILGKLRTLYVFSYIKQEKFGPSIFPCAPAFVTYFLKCTKLLLVDEGASAVKRKEAYFETVGSEMLIADVAPPVSPHRSPDSTRRCPLLP